MEKFNCILFLVCKLTKYYLLNFQRLALTVSQADIRMDAGKVCRLVYNDNAL